MDLLPHLAGKQMEKRASTVIEGEKMDVLIGSRPVEGEEKNAVKASVLQLLKEKYDIEEEDFLSAELEIVPAGKAREAGIDRSMIMSYGRDDRVCAFTSLKAILDMKQVERTACCILVDKEEIGSVRATGMESKFFENMVAELLDRTGEYSELKLRRCLANSRMGSSDVNAAYDPLYADAYEAKKTLLIWDGAWYSVNLPEPVENPDPTTLTRNTSRTSAISLTTKRFTISLPNWAKSTGGGRHYRLYSRLYGMEVIDRGVAVPNMHAPWEITSKADV